MDCVIRTGILSHFYIDFCGILFHVPVHADVCHLSYSYAELSLGSVDGFARFVGSAVDGLSPEQGGTMPPK